MKEFNVKFKEVNENEITIKAKDKKEVLEKIKELFISSEYKDLDISNFTKHYYVVELENKEVINKKK